MRVNIVLIALVTASVATYGVSGASSQENDGGTGGDAGNLLQDALVLTSLGLVHGNLTSLDDVDWYAYNAVSTSVPTCVQGGWSTDYPMSFRLSGVNADRAMEVVSKAPGGRVGVAVPPGYTGHVTKFATTASLPPLLPYNFQTSHIAPPSSGGYKNDGGSGRDSTASNPVALTKGCIGGAVQPNGGDSYDLYTFAGSAGSKVMLSLASDGNAGTLTLLDVNGTALMSAPSGSFLSYTLPYTGDYGIAMSQSSGSMTTYVIGACHPECEPPTHPCNPMCIDMLRD